MKQVSVMKLLVGLFVALVAFPAYADLLGIYNPELHRIGYEVFVYVAGVVMGSALVRYLAKKDWRVGEKWKDYSEMEYTDAVEIEKKIEEVRAAFRTAVRVAYGKAEGLLKAGWKYDLVLAALETDDELMSRCKGIPIECLMNEAAEEVKGERETRLASVSPDFKTAFDAVYDDAAMEWLRKDAEEKAKRDAQIDALIQSDNSFWGKVRQFFSVEYRHKVKAARLTRIVDVVASYKRGGYCARKWDVLCSSLVDGILERNESLRIRCRGVESNALVEAVSRRHPGSYNGAYPIENDTGHVDGMVSIGDDEVVDIIKLRREEEDKRRREEDDRRFWTEYGEHGIDDDKWELCFNGGRKIGCSAERPIIIGRSHVADIQVKNTDVSGRHLAMKFTPSGPQVLVLSSCGATVNGKELAQGDVATVSDGSEILLGSSVKIVVNKVSRPLSEPMNNDSTEV